VPPLARSTESDKYIIGAVIGILVPVVVILATVLLMGEGKAGPEINFQSAISAQALGIPADKGASVTYGVYHQGIRAGEVTLTYLKDEYYGGELCKKFEGTGNISTSIGGTRVNFSMGMTGYMVVDGEMPKHWSFTYYYTQPQQMTLSLEWTWHRERSEMVTEISGLGISQSTTAYLPDEYWEPITIGDLYVGYSKEMTYTIDSIPVTLSISVTQQEDVVVPVGTYEDCYVVSITQPEVDQEFTFWVNKEGIAPKMETSMSVGFTSFTLTLELESYGY
jgi:hypothetical protein